MFKDFKKHLLNKLRIYIVIDSSFLSFYSFIYSVVCSSSVDTIFLSVSHGIWSLPFKYLAWCRKTQWTRQQSIYLGTIHFQTACFWMISRNHWTWRKPETPLQELWGKDVSWSLIQIESFRLQVLRKLDFLHFGARIQSGSFTSEKFDQTWHTTHQYLVSRCTGFLNKILLNLYLINFEIQSHAMFCSWFWIVVGHD